MIRHTYHFHIYYYYLHLAIMSYVTWSTNVNYCCTVSYSCLTSNMHLIKIAPKFY